MPARLLAPLLLLATLATACAPNEEAQPPAAPTTSVADTTTSTTQDVPAYLRPDLPTETRVDDLLSRMTLAEKIGQMTLVEKNSVAPSDLAGMGIGALLSGGGGGPHDNTPEGWAEMVREFQEASLGSRLGIPLLYGVDAVHGHNNVPGAVIFPHNIGLGAANDPDLMTEIGRITAAEVIATNIHWNYAPAVSVPQDIRWGRTYEGYSENTDRVTELAGAYLRGLQGDSLADPDSILATPKHFVGDGGTAWGSATTNGYQIDQGVTEVDEATLREIHLPPYRQVIEDGALSIMASYSSWGGEKMHAQRYLLTDVLKDELGFEGFVVSDWEAIDQISDDYDEAVIRAINAGIDMNMVPFDYLTFVPTLTAAVESGAVPMERIDDAVRRILRAKFELGLFEQPHGDERLLAEVGADEHRAVAREAVAKSQVLLQNDGSMLPLGRDLERLYVAGQAADDIGLQSGGWTIEWQGGIGPITEGTSILGGLAETMPSTEIVYDRRGRFEPATPDESMTCLVIVGEWPYAEGAGDDAEPRLPDGSVETVERLAAQCERLALVIVSGRPLLIAELVDRVDAVVAAWLPGSEGAGVADVLVGDIAFSGTSPYTWPRSADQLGGPIDDPLFAYGHGLTTDDS